MSEFTIPLGGMGDEGEVFTINSWKKEKGLSRKANRQTEFFF